MELGLATMEMEIPLSLSSVDPLWDVPLGENWAQVISAAGSVTSSASLGTAPMQCATAWCWASTQKVHSGAPLQKLHIPTLNHGLRNRKILIPLTVDLTHKNIHFPLCFRKRNFKANVSSSQLNSEQNVRWLSQKNQKWFEKVKKETQA